MPFVEWEAKYLLGVEQFDLHHEQLVGLLNEAYEMFVSKELDDRELLKMLEALADYSNYHFNMEEDWMGQVGYPKQKEHMLEHKRFIYKLYQFNLEFKEDKANLTLEIVSFLRRWLLEHIQNDDAQYGMFIRERTG